MASQGRIELPKPGGRNHLWAMDFMQDALYDGRRIRVLPIIDTYTKECLRIEVDTSIGGRRVAEILSQITALRGLPDRIVVDNVLTLEVKSESGRNTPLFINDSCRPTPSVFH